MSEVKEKIVLIGGGGHARSVVDAIERMGVYDIIGFVDADPTTSYKSYRTIGCDDDLERIYKSGVHLAVICVGFLGNSSLRKKLYDHAKSIGFSLPVIIDPSSEIADDASMGEGSFIGKLAVVNSNARLGVMTIVNTAAIIEHDCRVDDFSHVAVNATLCGDVSVGRAVLIGAGSVVIQGVSIGSDALVGAGAIVLGNVAEGERAVGIYG